MVVMRQNQLIDFLNHLMDLDKRLRDFSRSVVTSEKRLRDFPPP